MIELNRKVWMFLCLCMGGSFIATAQPRVIADFDNRTDLNLLRGNNALLEWVSPAPEGMKGSGSARVTLKPGGSYPGFQTAAAFPGDWGGYGKLCIDFFNPSETSIKINVRIDDARSAGYSTRYNLEAWGMRPGPSTLTLEFPRLQIEDRSRLIDVSKIKAVYFFSAPVKQPVEYFIGSIRLEPAPQADKPLPEGFQAFDFGSDGSPLWPGFVKVTPSTAFDEERGFGFLSSVPLSPQDLGVPDPLARDAISGSVWRPYEYGFAIKVKPGRYGVQAIARHIGPDRLPTRSGSITAEGAEVYRRNIPKEVFYSDEILYRGLSRPYRLDQDAFKKFFSPDLDWHRFEVEVGDGRLNLIFENLAVFALAVYPIDQMDSVEKRLAEIDRSRREFFGEKVYYEEKRSPKAVTPTPEEQAAGMLAWSVPYWEGIAPWSRPANRTGEPSAQIAVAQGEYEPITVAVAPLRDLELSVRIEEAKGPEGAVLSAERFEARLVQYRETRRSEGIYAPKESFMPSVRGPMALQSALAQRFWITLHVPDDASPGVYRGAVVLQSQGASPLRIPIEVEVLPLTLPESSEALFAWYYRDPGQLNYFLNFFDPTLKPGQLEREMRDMKAHGCNSVEFPAPAIKSISAQGDVEFDFSTWDLYAETARRVGIGLDDPPQTFIIELANSLGKKGIKEGTESFAMAYRNAVLKLEEWSRRERLPLVFWVVDEPREKLKNSWNRSLAETLVLLKALDGIEGLRTTVTPMADIESGVDYGSLADAVDVLQTHPWSNSKRLMERARARGVPVWSYNAGADRLSFGFHPWAAGLQGRYQWHYAFWKAPYDIFAEGWGVTFPSPEGPLPTPEYERTREGIEDWRWLNWLERLCSDSPQSQSSIEARALLDSIRKDTPLYLDDALVTGLEEGKGYEGGLNARMVEWRRQVQDAIIGMTQEGRKQ